MKVLGISGSPRKNGNSEVYMNHTLKAVAEEGLDTELLRLAGLNIRPCDACMACHRGKPCPIKDDVLPIYARMRQADAILVASPVYFSSVPALTKGLLERVGYMCYGEKPFAGKVGGPLVVARRAGQNFTFAELLQWFYIMGMVVPGSSYWSVAFGRDPGEVSSDEEGLATAWNFGKNVARVTQKLNE